jgi:hypothetical protein
MNLLKQRAIAPDTTVDALSPESKSNVSSVATRHGDALSCILLTVVVLAVFYQTVFLQKPISRISLIAEWDSLFAALRRGTFLNIDPSAVLLALPTYTTIAGQYQSGMLPLWNNLNAFGSPLVGDIQATVFSPLRWLFNVMPNMQIYNLQLVMQVEVAAVTTYFLSRKLDVSRVASVFAALSYALCPFVLWYLELQSGVGYVLNPLVLWLFVRAAKLQTTNAALVAGLGAGATILMGHPETSFFAIVFGSLMMAVLMWPNALHFARTLGLTAIATLCTCAPSFLPFVEFAKNSDCYKYGVSESAFIPWQALVANLCSPVAAGASPYLGIFVAAFALMSLFKARSRTFASISAVALLCFILAAKLWPFSLVSNVPPFNYLITVYAVPVMLVAVSVLAGLGLTHVEQSLRSANADARRVAVIATTVCLGVVCALPFGWQLTGHGWSAANFDMTLPPSALQIKVWLRDVLFAAVTVVALGAAFYRRRAIPVLVVAVALLNTAALMATVKGSLPAQPKFELPKIEAMEFLRRSGERSLAVGTHLAKPDVNLLYGVDDVRSINAMLPPRYLGFVNACGASADQFTQWFGEHLTPVMDLGSVRYILSQTPVVSEYPSVREGGTWLVTDAENQQVTGRVALSLPAPTQGAICLVSREGMVVWFGDRLRMGAQPQQPISVPLPTAANWHGYKLQAQLFDAKGNPSYTVDLGPVPAPNKAAKSRLRLVRQFTGGLRLYENTTALPRAYFVSQTVLATSREDALRQISSPAFNGKHQLVVEDSTLVSYAPVTGTETVELLERKPANVEVRYSAPAPGYVVLTDTFYPGWKAYVDRKPANLVRGNYLFRAVQVPAGNHTLTVRYEPTTFTIGVLLFFGFWIGMILLGLKGARKAL